VAVGESGSWSVGELAAAAGVSVRVLRHWDALGVVSPTRTAGGHRRYGPDDVLRLYRALALRRTGLPLERIADLLSGRDRSPADTLRAHLRRLELDLAHATRLRDRFAAALDSLDDPPATGEEDIMMKVIAGMTMVDGYVHGHRPIELARLQDQADTLTELLHHDTGYAPGERILEVGCGVGAQTAVIAQRSPGGVITSIDVTPAVLERARDRLAAVEHDASVTFLQADATELPHASGPLAAGTFDHVVVCFVLEHLVDPAATLAGLRRMLRPGGSLTVIEGDHGSAYFHPDSTAAREAIDCQITLQRQAGGDALIGRRLRPLLAAAGFREVAVSPRLVYVDADHPDLADGFTRRTFTAMIAGVREPAVAAGLITGERFDAGVADLLRTAEDDGTFHYTFFRATGRAPS
jgi:DNA-binding transcriptional MerR regulator